jgi:O-antigen ligase
LTTDALFWRNEAKKTNISKDQENSSCLSSVSNARSGASRVATVNPHNQTFAVAIQIGLLGAIVLWAMWIAHFRLFREEGILAWMGTMIVVENIVSSFVHSHLFDSAHGWLYVFGVGVLGGMALRQRAKVIEIDLIR